MSERRRCIRCDRGIDAWAKICPFCNQDQSNPVPAVAAPVDYTPPAEKSLRRKLLMIGGGLLMLIVAFGVGMIINRDGTPDKAPETIEEQIAEGTPEVKPQLAKRADTQLIPVNEPIDQPITSAPVATPAAGMPNEYQRSDATAVSSVEYAQLAARAQAERKAATQQGTVDPRSITGRAYTPAPRRRTIAPPPANNPAQQGTQQTPMTSAAPAAGSPVPGTAVARTRPVPEYQPVPNISVSRSTNVRLDLMVGADGSVEEVRIRDTVPGQTARIISTVQRWRFKPATENGRPVAAPVSVDISFRGND